MDETATQVVGRKGKRRDQEEKPVNGTWGTDLIGNRDPDFVYQFFREDEVRDKLRPSRVVVTHFGPGDNTQTAHDIPGWTICRRDTGPEELEGYRPDEGKPLDTVLRHGPMVCLKIQKDHWAILQQVQEQSAASFEKRLNGGTRQELRSAGDQIDAYGSHVAPGNVRYFERPMSWERG